MRVTVTVEIVFLDGRILQQLLDYFMIMLFDILSNSSPSPFQFKSNGLGVDFVFPLSQEQEQEQEEQEEQPPPKSTTRNYTTDLKFGTYT